MGQPPLGTPILSAGRTCTRIVRANRLGFAIDFETYYAAAREALASARKSIILLGWDFDPRVRLEPYPTRNANRIGPYLNQLKRERPELDIRILIWAMALPMAAQHRFFPQRTGFWLDNGIHFHLDHTSPYGASRHEKILVIDDRLAFCGGGDFSVGRLDTVDHPDKARWRVTPTGMPYPPRHDVMMLVDGEAARSLGEHARERWREATDENVPAPEDEPTSQREGTSWPKPIFPIARDIGVGLIHTVPTPGDRPLERVNEALYLTAIRAARKLIYLENQYFTSPVIREALAARLAELDGPEIVMICTYRAPSYFDHATMDSARDIFVARLRRADAFNRFRAYTPYTAGGRPIIVHSKIAIIDDRLLRIGSTNLNNRSFGYDTETDVAFETTDGDTGLAIALAEVRAALVSHFLGPKGARFAAAYTERRSLIEAIDLADGETRRRLRPYVPRRHGWVQNLIARWHIGDPRDTSDAWRPWRRQQ